jgi:hypothetical protein
MSSKRLLGDVWTGSRIGRNCNTLLRHVRKDTREIDSSAWAGGAMIRQQAIMYDRWT